MPASRAALSRSILPCLQKSLPTTSANNNRIEGCREPGRAQARRELGSLRRLRPPATTAKLSFMRVRGAGSRASIMQSLGGGRDCCARLQLGHELNQCVLRMLGATRGQQLDSPSGEDGFLDGILLRHKDKGLRTVIFVA